MSSYNRYYCSSCYNVWDEDQYLPKILNCGHSFCLKCLKRLFNNNQIICPEDMQTQRVNSVMQLKTNEELLHPQPERIIQSSQQQQSQRSYQNISVQDSSYETVTQSTTRINRYNEINIKKPAQIIQKPVEEQIPWTRQQLLKCQQQLQETHQQFELNQQTHYNESYRLITQQKRFLTDQIQQKFSDLQIKIRNTESLVLQELNMIALQIEDDIRQMHIRLDKKTVQQILSIKERIDQLLFLPNGTLNQQADLVNSLSEQTILIIDELSKQENIIIQDVIDKKMAVAFDLSVYNYIPEFCTFQKSKKQKPKSKSTRRVHTLNDDSMTSLQKSPRKDHDNSTSKPQIYSKNAPHILDDIIERQSQRQLTFGRSLHENVIRKSEEIKSRSISGLKLYESAGINRIEDSLFKGITIEKLDLSNQNLTDQDIQELVKMITQSKSEISIIKLVRNKITDIGFSQILKLIVKRNEIHTVNLANNHCTEHAIEMIERRLSQLKGKTFYLTNCKINNLTQLKVKQHSFQSKGVTMYL